MRRKVLCECDGLKVCDMTLTDAKDIAEWKYPAPYDVYDFGGFEEENESLLAGDHFGVTENGKLVGFVSLGPSAQIPSKKAEKIYKDESYTDIALGVRPKLCGKGNGRRVTNAAIALAKAEFPEDGVRLTVEAANLRAIKVYEKCGFEELTRFRGGVKIAGGKKIIREFVIMIK